MEYHEPDQNDPWVPRCDYVCKREGLVASVLEHARRYGVVVIRATPQVGKTVLLELLGHHIAHEEPSLEPVYIYWQTKEDGNTLPYDEYLVQELARWQRKNTRIRPHNPAARPIYLIDEAQGSYEHGDFWSMLKNYHSTRTQPLFVLVCVYGAAGVSQKRDPNIESQAQRMHSLQRIELRPTRLGGPCMLLPRQEVDFILDRFAIDNDYRLTSGVTDYFYSITGGHPGILGLLLSHVEKFTLKVSPMYLHNYVGSSDMLIDRHQNWEDFVATDVTQFDCPA